MCVCTYILRLINYQVKHNGFVEADGLLPRQNGTRSELDISDLEAREGDENKDLNTNSF